MKKDQELLAAIVPNSIKEQRSKKDSKSKNTFTPSTIFALVLAFVSFSTITNTMVKAGSLTPPGEVSSTMHSLQEIWEQVSGSPDTSATVASSTGGVLERLEFLQDFLEATTTYSYASNDGALVLNTAEKPGTFNAANLSSSTVKFGTVFGSGQTGAYPSLDHPLLGDTGNADATTTKVCDGYEYWGKDGVKGEGGLSVPAEKLGVGETVCGTAGTLLKNLFSGTATTGPSSGTLGGAQDKGGVDDYHNGSSPPTDRYATSWTKCNSGNSYCGTGLSSADAKDNATGLIFSYPCTGLGCASFSSSSAWAYSWDNSATAYNGGKTAYELCASGAHGESGWYLPHQKQLMQAYINGAYGNLVLGTYGTYWSATTGSALSGSAWRHDLDDGDANLGFFSNRNGVRCVRLG